MENNIHNKYHNNYYSTIQNQLKKQYPGAEKKEIGALAREVVFAPRSYKVQTENNQIPVIDVRETLADSIENDGSKRGFIAYSLDADIADLIEKNSCETSSMNEYYRWVSLSSEIIQHTADGNMTGQEVEERKQFLDMSMEREAEILLCLALYQGAGLAKNQAKVNMLTFKLARLCELRSIVRNTPDHVTQKPPADKEKLLRQYDYCQQLLQEKNKQIPNFNLKLKININDNIDEDLEDDFSFFEYLQGAVLLMMRELEDIYTAREHREATNVNEAESSLPLAEKENTSFNGLSLSSINESDGR